MAVAGLQETVLEAPGLEELAKEAPSLEELASKLALDGFVYADDFSWFEFQTQIVKKYQARLCKILLVVKTYNLLMQHYLSIRAKPISGIIVDVFGNIINLSGKNYIVFGTH